MSLRSAVLTLTGTWRCPTGVSFVWVNQVAQGGGGQGQAGLSGSADAGGAGEFYCGATIPVTAGTQYGVTVGSGSNKGIGLSSVAGSNGAATTFSILNAIGGFAGDSSSTTRGNGGGPNGAVTPTSKPGLGGTAESPTAFGGASGGVRGGSSGIAGGPQIGEWTGGLIGQASTSSFHSAGGCGGGASLYASGATGGDAYSGGGPDPDDGPAVANGRDGSLGSGGGGAPQDAGGTANASDGGDGGGGMVQIFWIAP